MASAFLPVRSESTSTEEPMEADEQIVGNISEGARKEEVKDGPNSASSYDQTKETRQAFNDLKNAVLAATKALEDNYTTLKVKEETFYKISRMISSINFESSIKLNVGGHIYQTSLETLTKHAGSLLAEMFSASFNIKQSNDGSYFIDRDGTHFRHILNYLRSGTLPVSSILKSDSEEILNEAEYYRLAGLVQAIKAKLNGDDEISCEDIKEADKSMGNGLEHAAKKELSATEEKLNSFLCLLDSNLKSLDKATSLYKEVSMKLPNVHFGESIKLDVGGRQFKTSLKTLRKESQSILASMFSETFDLKKENDGSYFIDRDGLYFNLILNYLRDGKISDDILEEHGPQMENEAEFFGLSGLKEQIYNYNHVKLNVGGEDFVVTREILKKHPDSMFGRMIAGQECDFERRHDGSYFVQHDATNFPYILDYLRFGTISDTAVETHADKLLDDAIFYRLPCLQDQIHKFVYIWIQLGSKKYRVCRKVLNKFPGSMFAKMLAGEECEYVKRIDGSYYIDHDGTYFNLILNFLRDGKMSDDILEEHGPQMENEAEFYELSELKEQIHNYNHVKLNVGGEDFVVTRKMLRKHPESMFGRMISGEECAFEKRHDGSYFVKHDATYFPYILDYLRLGTISDAVFKKFSGKLLDDAIFYRLSGLQDQVHNFLYVQINIGGKQYIVSRKVLNKFPESLFARMLAGKEGCYVKRIDGSYFIQYDATNFHHILLYLSLGTISDGVIEKYGASLLEDAEFFLLPGLKVQINNYFIVKVNIGGREFVISREVLKKFPKSLFGKMLAGGGGEYVKRSDGSYYIDRDGSCFGYIHKYLKSKQLPQLHDQDTRNKVQQEAEFYGLTDIMAKMSRLRFPEYVFKDRGGRY